MWFHSQKIRCLKSPLADFSDIRVKKSLVNKYNLKTTTKHSEQPVADPISCNDNILLGFKNNNKKTGV